MSEVVASAFSARAPRLLSVLQDVYTKPENVGRSNVLVEIGVVLEVVMEAVLEVGMNMEVDIVVLLEGVFATLIEDAAEVDVIIVLVVAISMAPEVVGLLDVAVVEDVTVGETAVDVERALVDPVERT